MEARTLRAEDFSADQVRQWCDAGGGHERSSGSDDQPVTEWVVGYTNPKRERDVERELRRRSFAVYVPAMTVTKRRKDVARPLLPRYAFIGLRAGQSYMGLEHTPGFEGLVRFGAEPARVRPSLIAGLKQQQTDGVFDFSDAAMAEAAERAEAEAMAERVRQRESKQAALVPPVRVRMVSGPWLGFTGTLVEHLPGWRVSVLMRFCGREFPAPMVLDDVEAIMLRK
ncbi:transcription termination/antitermination protein NusG [Methylobacterium gnaphalii]|uniref:NusG-like N-terminal domain-containing protein n=1 Tax=Methylobacterium gnaphalii TaxID=1010610 RepID=A0A512JQN7_9HYPH|nr:transcription termination/antitermination NusG family protein [Methylobacterium gnaphalii]GEP12268.1 hypothetical protein MGN01_41130 [Methylobacterium gnaphalii]GJD68729.1 Transcription antitermination protein RfaH [Methylobacterium gnaphalii]GLS49375.1 hypothetical protein GCM10007885_22230 [Methylobacterium gnaphalii]